MSLWKKPFWKKPGFRIALITLTLAGHITSPGVYAQNYPQTSNSQTLVQQWQQGLAGSKLTAFDGSRISSNSTLTVIDFCRNGRYRYYKEGSWSVPGMAGGASTNSISGRWSVQQQSGYIVLVYATDAGQQGMFPMYLQQNGRVNLGGTAYAVQRGGAGC